MPSKHITITACHLPHSGGINVVKHVAIYQPIMTHFGVEFGEFANGSAFIHGAIRLCSPILSGSSDRKLIPYDTEGSSLTLYLPKDAKEAENYATIVTAEQFDLIKEAIFAYNKKYK